MPALTATYRLQFGPGFRFDEAAAVAPYLAALGISHVYCSPYLQAGPDSTHGYDVADPTRVSDDLGGEAAHGRFLEVLKEQGLGQILDIVPNHMSGDPRANRWWWDLLEHGRYARSAPYFDLNWSPRDPKLQDKVLLPVLGDHYGRTLERRELQVVRDGASLEVAYHDRRMPLTPHSLDTVFSALEDHLGRGDVSALAAAIRTLPPGHDDAEGMYQEQARIRGEFEELLAEEPAVAQALDAIVAEINASPATLDGILSRQHYRLAYWRTGSHEINYRRFFVENALVGVCIENERVFGAMHGTILRGVRDGWVDGLRVDHIDGLRDPERYLERLREQAPEVWIGVEKILDEGESMPASWPVDGTTGYDFLNRVSGLFVDPSAEDVLTEFYAEFTGESVDYPAQVREKKLHVLRTGLASEVNRLALLLLDISEKHWRYRDYTLEELGDVLRELLAAFPVYRTYTRPEVPSVSEQDQRYIEEAVGRAKASRPDVDPMVFEFLCDLLLLRGRGEAEIDFVLRFQQLSGPAMAKGVEDTLFYTYNRLVSLNEVGGNPHRFGVTAEEFHEACRATLADWPRTMTATSTHDTKRSGDVRARLHLLSETPDEWRDAVRRWSRNNERHRRDDSPSRNDEYLLYQTLVGAWPIEADRAVAYMIKAAREAKTQTKWIEPSESYESALEGFVRAVLEDDAFVSDLQGFVAPRVLPGRINGLAQVLLKLAAPGFPDTYQGTELWDLSLVDPDNRRPVDYEIRRRLLEELPRLSPEDVMARMDEGLPMLWLLHRGLHLRRRRPRALGRDGAYTPLSAEGSKAAHVVAFSRGDEAMAVAPRWPLRLAGDWAGTTLALPDGNWTHVLTGDSFRGTVPLEELLRRFPVALLEREEGA